MILQSSELVVHPIVSVIIPSYNRADTVGQTIDSILSQKSNFDFEIVIGDDCSTDQAREVLLEYQEQNPTKIKLLFHDTNLGLGANWATCVQQCRGKYLANCDNDDYWHNVEKLQLQVDFMESHPEYGVCHTDFRTHNRESGEIKEVKISNIEIEKPLIQSLFKGKFQFCNATMMYKMELLKSKINLDDYIQFRFTLQDWNTWMILSKYTDFYCLPISTATFGIETESITRPQSYDKLEKRLVEEKKMYKYICHLFPDDLNFDGTGYDLYKNSVLLNLAYKKSDYQNAKKYGHEMISSGNKNLKATFSQKKTRFYLFVICLKLKRIISGNY